MGYLGVSWGRPGAPKAYFQLPEVKTHAPEARHDPKDPSNIQKDISGRPKFTENTEKTQKKWMNTFLEVKTNSFDHCTVVEAPDFT